jgi:hypothetical protein
MGEGIVAAASALRPLLLQFGHPERRSLSLLLERATWATWSLIAPRVLQCEGVVHTRGDGTGVPFVMAP